MDEGYVEDVTMVSRADAVRAQGKESENLVESGNVLEARQKVILREGDFRRSSIQQFVDILGGKDVNTDVNIVDMSQDPCTSYNKSEEVRVQELTLGDYNTDFSTMNEGEMMETISHEWQHGNQPGIRSEAEIAFKHFTDKEEYLSTSSASKDSNTSNELAFQGFNQSGKLSPGQSTYNDSDAVLRHALASGTMRMKIISRSTEGPEYFIKNTLKGKGVLCRGPVPATVESKGQHIVKAAAGPLVASSPPVNTGHISVLPSNSANTASGSCEAVNDGINFREWMSSRQKKLLRVDSLNLFKQILDLVYSCHSDGKVLVDLRPSWFRLLPSKEIVYLGRMCAQNEMQGSVMHKDVQNSQALKRPLEQGMLPHSHLGAKHHKSIDNVNFLKMKSQFQLGYGPKLITNRIDANLAGPGDSKTLSRPQLLSSAQRAFSSNEQQEMKWYRSPEELLGRACTSSSNIYSLGIFFFEVREQDSIVFRHLSDMRWLF